MIKGEELDMKRNLKIKTMILGLLVASTTPGIILSSTQVVAQIVPVPAIPAPVRPNICVERNLSKFNCKRLLSELQESRIIPNLDVLTIPKIRIPDHCLSCPPNSQINIPSQPINQQNDN